MVDRTVIGVGFSIPTRIVAVSGSAHFSTERPRAIALELGWPRR